LEHERGKGGGEKEEGSKEEYLGGWYLTRSSYFWFNFRPKIILHVNQIIEEREQKGWGKGGKHKCGKENNTTGKSEKSENQVLGGVRHLKKWSVFDCLLCPDCRVGVGGKFGEPCGGEGGQLELRKRVRGGKIGGGAEENTPVSRGEGIQEAI